METAGSTGGDGSLTNDSSANPCAHLRRLLLLFFIKHPVILIRHVCIEGSSVNIKDYFLQGKHAGVDYTAHKPAAVVVRRVCVKMSKLELEALHPTKIGLNKKNA